MLKKNVVTWVNDAWGPSKPPLSQRTKEGRGFSNEFTSRLLCPSEWRWGDDEQVVYCIEWLARWPLFFRIKRKIRNGDEDFAVTAQSWPNFFYAGYACDPLDLEKGLFKGEILVKVWISRFYSIRTDVALQAYKAILTSPSSAAYDIDTETLEGDGPPLKRARTETTATRSNNASLCGLKSVTPRSIAYVAVQVSSNFDLPFEQAHRS